MAGLKFFDKSKSLFKDLVTVVASTGNDTAKHVLSMKRDFFWESVGSDDVTTETITITLPATQAISRLFLVTHNFKKYQIKYEDSGLQDFTNVVGLEGSLSGIDASGYAFNTSYYTFDSVTTDEIVITVDTTQVVDAEKNLTIFIITNELGSFVGYPGNRGIIFDPNEKIATGISGLGSIIKGVESIEIDLNLSAYPNQADITLVDTLLARVDPFLVWPNAGLLSQFKLIQKGWKLQDIYQVQTVGDNLSGFHKNIYTSGVEKRISLLEVS